MTLLDHGCGEKTKALAHVAVLVPAAICCLYNLAAFLKRREPHNLRNAALYGVVVGLEGSKVRDHWQLSRACEPIPEDWYGPQSRTQWGGEGIG